MSTQRAFVIQFQPRTTAVPGRFAGRIEHVGSGAATHFSSPPEMLEFVERLLGGPAREDAAAPARPESSAPPRGRAKGSGA